MKHFLYEVYYSATGPYPQQAALTILAILMIFATRKIHKQIQAKWTRLAYILSILSSIFFIFRFLILTFPYFFSTLQMAIGFILGLCLLFSFFGGIASFLFGN